MIDQHTNSIYTPSRRLKALDPKALEELQNLRLEVSRLKHDLDLYKDELHRTESERDQLKEASFNAPCSERTIMDGRLAQENADLKAIIHQLTREKEEAVTKQFRHQDHVNIADSGHPWNQHPLASSRLSGSLVSSMNQSLYFDK